MQATAFSGAGKQAANLYDSTAGNTDFTLKDDSGSSNISLTSSTTLTTSNNPSDNQLKVASVTFAFTHVSGNYNHVSGGTPTGDLNVPKGQQVNGTIAATNKLITLFVMMFCVFTGDGYLQHYRRCCRDCWPTTGYTKYQSFFYWLRFGFKGGIKSITSSFTDLYYQHKTS